MVKTRGSFFVQVVSLLILLFLYGCWKFHNEINLIRIWYLTYFRSFTISHSDVLVPHEDDKKIAPFVLTGTRVDKGTAGPAVYLQSDGSHDILSSSDAASFIHLTDTKGKAWSGNPIGVDTTATGYELILETVGKKGTSYSEISVSSDGSVAKKGSTLTSLQILFFGLTYRLGLFSTCKYQNGSFIFLN